jgi:O-acetylhomoserine/O-acetylserine sulfhydrylase-like pyridoxal-dependent enzyme
MRPNTKVVYLEALSNPQVKLTDKESASLEEALNQCRVYGHRGLGGF